MVLQRQHTTKYFLEPFNIISDAPYTKSVSSKTLRSIMSPPGLRCVGPERSNQPAATDAASQQCNEFEIRERISQVFQRHLILLSFQNKSLLVTFTKNWLE